MRHYSVTIMWVQRTGFQNVWTYNVAETDSVKASQAAFEVAKVQFPQGESFLVQSVIWDGNSAVL